MILQELDLNTAKLNTIESDSFKYQANSLEKLDLSNNNLKTLPVDALKSLKHLKYLDLSSNKWICDDRLKKGWLVFKDSGNTWPSEKNLVTYNFDDLMRADFNLNLQANHP